MKILIFIDQFSTGGGARVVSRLLDGFVLSGHDVILATKLSEKHYPIPEQVKVVPFEIKVHPNKLLALSLTHFEGIKLCRRICKSIKPDIIIGEMSITFMWSYFGSRWLNIPIVAHDHTSFSRKINPLTDFIRNHLYGLADALVILTERDKNILQEKFPRKVVINNPLPFDPIKEVPVNRRKAILCVGRFDVWEVKGFDIMIEVFSRLSPKYPDWILEFAGTGSEESVSYIIDLVEQNGLTNQVKFYGQLSDIKSLYQQVQIFALSSRVEGMPMCLMEAMSQGCACVAFEVGGASQEMLENGVSGYCINDGDITGFEQALAKLISDGSLVNEISNNAMRASEKFSLSSIIQKWTNLLTNTIKLKYGNNLIT